MGDYLRLLTVHDRDVPLATLQRAVPYGAVWSVEHPGMLGNISPSALSPTSSTTCGTFSPWPLSLVDRADSLLLNVGE